MIIHRSANRVIFAGANQTNKPNLDGALRGWKSPQSLPYRPIGTFQKVVPVIEELKVQLENCLELSPDAQKAINVIKRNADNLYVGGDDPQRTWNSISKGVVSMQKTKAGDTDQSSSKKARNFGPDGKRKTGYQINPA